MALFVNSNVASLNAQRNLSNATNDLSTSFERLSSGKRINSAKDDAAGLSISTRLSSQVNGLNQGIRNANDGISVAQTAEGALEETSNILQRIRTLAVQSTNGSNGANDIAAIKAESDELVSEISRIANDTEFAGKKLLNGAGEDLSFQVGANGGQNINIDFSAANFTSSALSIGALDFTAGAAAITSIDAALKDVNDFRATLGAKQNRFDSTIRNQSNTSANLEASRSRIEDTDFAQESANLAKNQVLQQASSSLLAQANQQPQIALSLIQ